MSANGRYSNHDSVSEYYWPDLEVSFDAINELSEEQQSRRLQVFLDVMSLEELKELANITEVVLTDPASKEQSKNDPDI